MPAFDKGSVHMIQDIAPKQFSTAYDLHVPESGDTVCLFRGSRILGARCTDGELRLPRFCELPVQESDCWFLFSVSSRNYFWCRRALTPAGGDYSWVSLRRSMAFSPQHEAFAALTARHLARWYEDNRYCGRCGRGLVRDAKERALLCPECGNLIYPRINPVIIVGVVDGERLLVTKYAPSHAAAKQFALVAGFCEIGETAEDTVRREVWEEVGLRVQHIRYYGSQPWGIDGNLSLGFFADLEGSDAIQLETDELSQALWLHRSDLPARSDTMALTSDMMEAFRTGKIS